MLSKTKIRVGLAILGLGILGAFKGLDEYYSKKLSDMQTKYKKEVIAQDELTKLNDSLSRRIVQDVSTIRDLRDLNDSLELQLDKPTQVTTVTAKPENQEGTPEEVEVKDSIVRVKDKYPKIGKTFVTYEGKVNTNTKEAIGKFEFEEMSIALGIEEKEDGIYYVNTKVPSYLNITEVNVKSLPKEPAPVEEPKNIGFIAGTGLGYDYGREQSFLNISAGIRINKVYIEAIGGSNKTLSAGVKFEF